MPTFYEEREFYDEDPIIREQQMREELNLQRLSQEKSTPNYSLPLHPSRTEQPLFYPRTLTKKEMNDASWEVFKKTGINWNHRHSEKALRDKVRSVRGIRYEDRRVQDIRDQVLGDHPHRGDVLRYLSSRDKALIDEALRDKALRDKARDDIWPLSKYHSKRVKSQNIEGTIRYSATASTQGSNLLLSPTQRPNQSPSSNKSSQNIQPGSDENVPRPQYGPLPLKMNRYPKSHNTRRHNRSKRPRNNQGNR